MKLTIIISYYRALDNLKLILQALNQQSVSEFEVILSEDDFNTETTAFITNEGINYKFKIKHLFQQEDKGFRKNMMLNRSIMVAASEKIVFIDGDCIPHKHFAKAYIQQIQEGFIASGRSVMLGEKFTQTLKSSKNLKLLNWLNLLFSDSKSIKEGVYFPIISLSYRKRGLLGRNWGVMKKHLIEINGFDEDYVLAGVGEDVDIEWRLLGNGLKTKSVKNKAIIYHIYHPRSYSDADVKINYKLLDSKLEANKVFCKNGIVIHS